ncbi:MAG: nucleotide sugar dehydrogenase [Candidatus Omnitrophica bacterium]|nr:nucleotide sugar dehydrogenase [Candidatus Omnitrophota bacterium]
MMLKDVLIRSIESKDAKIGVIGLGYVGLPLAVEFAKKGFRVYGIDVSKKRVKSLNSGSSYILDISSKELQQVIKNGRLSATTNFSILKILQVIIICVPTPLRKTREPDISYIISATKEVSKNFGKGKIVVLESTTYPGTTEEIILPTLSINGLKVGRDFFLTFSPERVDPANKNFKTANIPKVVGGITEECTEIAKILYGQIVREVIGVTSTKTAEMVKLLENTFRSVNIGLVNEIALMCDKLGIDVWEVIDAAKTKPFGFMPFYPGPGLGGHCIPIDPLYLSWKARMYGFEARFIELASQVNSQMPNYVVEKISGGLNRFKKSINGSKILLVGVAYKRDVNDTRESPAIEIIKILMDKGADVNFFDPYVSELDTNGLKVKSIKLNKDYLKKRDCVVIVTDHSTIDYKFVVDNSKLIVDTRNALKCVSGNNNSKIIKL